MLRYNFRSHGSDSGGIRAQIVHVAPMTIDLSRPVRNPAAAFCTATRSPVAHAYHCGHLREKKASNSDLGVRTQSHMSKINKFPDRSKAAG